MIFTVSIAGVTPDTEVYGGLPAAINYIGAKFGQTSLAWLGLSSDQQGQTLVTATRYIDEQPWDGDATGLVGTTPTTLQFPRLGLKRNDIDVDSTTVPPEVVQAVFELSILIAQKPTIVDQVDQGSNIQSVGGGGAPSVSYFAQTSAARGTATVMPTVVQRLLGRFLATPAANLAGGAAGTGRTCSGYSQQRQYNLVLPE